MCIVFGVFVFVLFDCVLMIDEVVFIVDGVWIVGDVLFVVGFSVWYNVVFCGDLVLIVIGFDLNV